MTVTSPSEQLRRSSDGMTMDDVTQTPAHAKPARRDLLWVLVLILACGLLEVWASWLSIGAVSGFPKLGRMTTGWILPVTTEAYWSAALFAWIAVPAGPKSAAFAKWSAAGMFVLSLAGQESDHLLAAAGRTVPPVGVVGFVTALPLISVALIAILIHLRQTDRDDAAAAVRARAETERAARQASAEAVRIADLEGALETAGTSRDEAVSALGDVRAELDRAREEVAKLTRKLEAATARKRRTATGRKSGAATARKPDPVTGSATAPQEPVITAPEIDEEAPADLDSEAKVLWYMDQGLSASAAGKAAGLTDSRGRQIARLRKPAPTDIVDSGPQEH